MRVPITGSVAAMALVLAACAPTPEVQTDVAPDAGLASLRTFSVVEVSDYLGDIQPGETHPAFANSATSRALGRDIAADLERHGYTVSDQSPDVLVEYVTAVKEPHDPTDESYNYLWRAKDWRGWGPGRNDATPAEYAQGAVIIDVVDAKTKQLLWRGHGPADASDDQASSVKRLDQAVDAILDHFPQRSVALSQAVTSSQR
jgi:Domain of unknown function (DUF4136)